MKEHISGFKQVLKIYLADIVLIPSLLPLC